MRYTNPRTHSLTPTHQLTDPTQPNPTHYKIQRAAQTVLGVYLKRTCSRITSASSAQGFLTIMRYTNPCTHSS